MIVNEPDLVPLNPVDDSNSKKPKADDFSARIAESYDSIEMLLSAREEATEAEAKAKAAGETPLPFAKEAAPATVSNSSNPDLAKKQMSFSAGGSASDDESPAMILGAGDLGLLSDARSMSPESPGQPAQLAEANEKTAAVEADGLASLPAAAKAGILPVIKPDIGVDSDRSQLHRLDETHINDLLKLTVQHGASDLHLTANLPPMVRKDGGLVPLPYVSATEQDTKRILYDILHGEHIEKFERTHELDFSYGVKGIGRFRFNLYKQRGSVAGAMRVIPNVIPTMEQLKLPPILRELTRKHAGLVLVTGPTGSGKSTTIASIIDVINTERDSHILTIEDPIEYMHVHKRSMVNQRELGGDTDSFNNALRAALREDPDVILVGEMRDLETIAAAITLAETGHLVFGTLHTRCASATIDRIVDVFPSYQQEQIRTQLATSIQAVVAQQLLPRTGGGRVAAIEIMIATSAVRNLIREGKTYQINSVIETGHQYGMQAMDNILADLYRSGVVNFEEAGSRAIDRENFQRLVKGY